jgi:hypothetical protein
MIDTFERNLRILPVVLRDQVMKLVSYVFPDYVQKVKKFSAEKSRDVVNRQILSDIEQKHQIKIECIDSMLDAIYNAPDLAR